MKLTQHWQSCEKEKRKRAGGTGFIWHFEMYIYIYIMYITHEYGYHIVFDSIYICMHAYIYTFTINVCIYILYGICIFFCILYMFNNYICITHLLNYI